MHACSHGTKASSLELAGKEHKREETLDRNVEEGHMYIYESTGRRAQLGSDT